MLAAALLEVYHRLVSQRRVQKLTQYKTECLVRVKLPPSGSSQHMQARPLQNAALLPYGGDAHAATLAQDRAALRAIFEAREQHQQRRGPARANPGVDDAAATSTEWVAVDSTTLVPVRSAPVSSTAACSPRFCAEIAGWHSLRAMWSALWGRIGCCPVTWCSPRGGRSSMRQR